MKHIIKLMLLLLSITTLTPEGISQSFITKGTSLIGGSISIGQTDSENVTGPTLMPQTSALFDNGSNFRFAFSPTYAYAIKENLMIGSSMLFERRESELTRTTDVDNSIFRSDIESWGFDLYLRWYYEIEEKFGAFLEPLLTASWTSRENSFVESQVDTNVVISENESQFNERSQSLGLNLGLYYFINSKFLVETMLGGISIGNTDSNIQIPSDFNSDRSVFQLDFVNSLRFDELLTINYLF